jgi:hypothetical protein
MLSTDEKIMFWLHDVVAAEKQTFSTFLLSVDMLDSFMARLYLLVVRLEQYQLMACYTFNT